MKPKIPSIKPLVAMVRSNGPRTMASGFSDPLRKSAADRGYGWDWQKLRLRILKRDGYICRCDRCKEDGVVRPAHEVDHRIPKFEGGTDADDNLQAINRDCHALKTQAEAKRALAAGIKLDQFPRGPAA